LILGNETCFLSLGINARKVEFVSHTLFYHFVHIESLKRGPFLQYANLFCRSGKSNHLGMEPYLDQIEIGPTIPLLMELSLLNIHCPFLLLTYG
jgi:hypothetical protein